MAEVREAQAVAADAGGVKKKPKTPWSAALSEASLMLLVAWTFLFLLDHSSGTLWFVAGIFCVVCVAQTYAKHACI